MADKLKNGGLFMGFIFSDWGNTCGHVI
jgi:hypothetical protein